MDASASYKFAVGGVESPMPSAQLYQIVSFMFRRGGFDPTRYVLDVGQDAAAASITVHAVGSLLDISLLKLAVESGLLSLSVGNNVQVAYPAEVHTSPSMGGTTTAPNASSKSPAADATTEGGASLPTVSPDNGTATPASTVEPAATTSAGTPAVTILPASVLETVATGDNVPGYALGLLYGGIIVVILTTAIGAVVHVRRRRRAGLQGVVEGEHNHWQIMPEDQLHPQGPGGISKQGTHESFKLADPSLSLRPKAFVEPDSVFPTNNQRQINATSFEQGQHDSALISPQDARAASYYKPQLQPRRTGAGIVDDGDGGGRSSTVDGLSIVNGSEPTPKRGEWQMYRVGPSPSIANGSTTNDNASLPPTPLQASYVADGSMRSHASTPNVTPMRGEHPTFRGHAHYKMVQQSQQQHYQYNDVPQGPQRQLQTTFPPVPPQQQRDRQQYRHPQDRQLQLQPQPQMQNQQHVWHAALPPSSWLKRSSMLLAGGGGPGVDAARPMMSPREIMLTDGSLSLRNAADSNA